MYSVLKFMHLLGMVVLVGNVTVTSIWKLFADRTRNPHTIGFAQRLVAGTDWSLTLSGIVLTMVGGYGMALYAGMPLLRSEWLLYGQLLFLVSGVIWAGILLPIQIKQARLAREFTQGGTIPDIYWKLGRLWLVWGVAATVPLVASMWFMISK